MKSQKYNLVLKLIGLTACILTASNAIAATMNTTRENITNSVTQNAPNANIIIMSTLNNATDNSRFVVLSDFEDYNYLSISTSSNCTQHVDSSGNIRQICTLDKDHPIGYGNYVPPAGYGGRSLHTIFELSPDGIPFSPEYIQFQLK